MSVTDPEHDFGEVPLVSGDTLKGFTASEDLDAFDGVEITGDFEVSEASNGGPGIGLNMYDVSAGEEVTIATLDGSNELRVVASDAGALDEAESGEALTYDGDGGFTAADSNNDDEVWGVAESDGTDGEIQYMLTGSASGVVGDSA